MNIKRFVLACVVVFLFVFFYEWGFHGYFMKEMYARTASMWRPEAEMSQHFAWLVLGQLLQAFIFCLIYTRSETAKQGVGFAIGYGFAIGLMRAGNSMIVYAVQPLPMNLIGSWIVGDLIEAMLAGLLVGLIYRTAAQPAPQPATA